MGSVYLDYMPISSGPQLAGLMLHLVHGHPSNPTTPTPTLTLTLTLTLSLTLTPHAHPHPHQVHGDPCTEWFDDKAASFRRLPALERELREALKVLPRSTCKPGPKPGPRRKSEGGGAGQGNPHAHGQSPAPVPRPAKLEYVPPQVHRRGMSKIVLRRYVH